MHGGNIGGQRRLRDGQEPMKWSIAGTGFAALCMKGFGEAHTQGTDGWVSWEPRYAWGRGEKEGPGKGMGAESSLCVRYP